MTCSESVFWSDPYLGEVQKEFLQHPTKVSTISFHSLPVVSIEDHLNYMTGPIVKLKRVVEVKREFRGLVHKF